MQHKHKYKWELTVLDQNNGLCVLHHICFSSILKLKQQIVFLMFSDEDDSYITLKCIEIIERFLKIFLKKMPSK